MAVVIGKDDKHMKRCSCKQCASIVEYVRNEVQERVDIDYTGGKDIVRYVTCPCCSHQIVVGY